MNTLSTILSTTSSEHWQDWRWQLKHAARSLEDLKQLDLINNVHTDISSNHYETLSRQYKTLITPYYLSLIDFSDPHCPIKKQAIPHLDELIETSGELSDPIGDQAHSPQDILVHRYPDRALLFPTFECPMYCRYCFRKETLNDSKVKLHQSLPQALSYIRSQKQLEEIILSGGDPLMLSTAKLAKLFEGLHQAGIKRLRIHSRMVVTLPQRINDELTDLFTSHQPNFNLKLVTHFNHPRELSRDAQLAIERLLKSGVRIFNQSVLLKGVNDHSTILAQLSKGLDKYNITPYYLHHPDLTRGTQHFRCSIDRGLEIYKALRGHISGYLIPRYVLDIPQGGGKVEVNSHAVRKGFADGEWILNSPLNGKDHYYNDLAYQS